MSWFGLSIATQGLYVARGALDVTAHNISNAETDGYSRQRVIQEATRPIDTGSKAGMWGTGAEIKEIRRVRDQYFDTKFWNSNSSLSEFNAKKLHLEQLEKMFNEPSDSGFSTSYNKFMDSLQSLTINPSDPSYKAQAIGMASNVASYFNTVSTNMSEYQRDLNQQVKQLVGEVNDLASQISKLNEQVYTLEMGGNQANDLRDQRDLLLDKLSAIVPVDVSYIEDSFGYDEMLLKINGETLLRHGDYNTLKVTEREFKRNPEDVGGLFDISWSNGNTFYINHEGMTGELQAVVDIRDGNNSSNFKGTISSVTSATEIVLKDTNRYDVDETGEIVINNIRYEYKVKSYDEASGELTLELTTDPPAKPDMVAGDVGEIATMGSKNYTKGIPYYKEKLNEFVREFAKQFNQILTKGQLADGTFANSFFVTKDINKGLPGTGIDLSDPYSYTQITAENFAVSEDIINDHTKFATVYSAASGESDTSLILDLIKIKTEKNFSNSDPANYMEMMIADIGIDSMKAQTFASNQTSINHTINNQRLSVLSVDLNEESMNMVKYQQAYNVAAKMINTFDELCDTTINGLIK